MVVKKPDDDQNVRPCFYSFVLGRVLAGPGPLGATCPKRKPRLIIWIVSQAVHKVHRHTTSPAYTHLRRGAADPLYLATCSLNHYW